MTKESWGRRALQRIKGSSIGFRLAGGIAALVLFTFPLASNALTGTNAKYGAGATSEAGARVAKWEVKLVCVEEFPKEEAVVNIPDAGTSGDHRLLLFFQGLKKVGVGDTTGTPVKKSAFFVMTLVNNSEVTARFTPKATAVDGTPDVAFFKKKTYNATTEMNDYSDELPAGGVVLAPGEDLDIYVVIRNSTFTGLKLGADCEQVN